MVAVIELLASKDGGATMTEIAGALAINPATAVHLLAALATAGFVVRDPADRRYHLGPALVRPGRLAEAHDPILAAARQEMIELSARFLLPCFAFRREPAHARLVHHTWAPGTSLTTVHLGETVPLTPPLGIVFVAWGSDAAFEGWLAQGPDLGAGHVERYRNRRSAIRRLGFVAELAPDPASRAGLVSVFDDRASPYRDGQLHQLLSAHGDEDHLLTDLDDPRRRLVTGISAPTFDGDGAVPLSLNLVTWSDPLSPARIADRRRRSPVRRSGHRRGRRSTTRGSVANDPAVVQALHSAKPGHRSQVGAIMGSGHQGMVATCRGAPPCRT